MYTVIIALLFIALYFFYKYCYFEPFEFIILDKISKKIVPIELIDKKDLIFSVRSRNFKECQQLCLDTPRCDGFNYFLNECDLYKNITHGY